MTASIRTVSGPLEPAAAAGVRDLVERAVRADGASPLSEAFLLALTSPGAEHVVATADGQVVGYAQRAPHPDGPGGVAELVVDPGRRRRGIGSALLGHLGDAEVWGHGDLPATAAFAAARGFVAVRNLYVMTRRLAGGGAAPVPAAVVPPDLVVRSFDPDRDAAAWLATNAAAFADHPEQGQLSRQDLQARIDQPWFDASGFLLLVPAGDAQSTWAEPAVAEPAVAGFHWTKVHPAGEVENEPVGEVYVVGVHPAYQGRGLGRVLTLLGLHHLEAAGLRSVLLYVDGANANARGLYRSLGFTDHRVDRLYRRATGTAGGTISP